MKEYAPYLTHQIARFGALTVPQMLNLCQGRCKKSTLYRSLSQLMHDRFIARISHTTKPLIGYAATRDLYPLVYGLGHERHTGVRTTELEHTVQVAQVMLELSHYSGVSGLATEHEWRPEEIREFCYQRIPDGIIQITQGNLKYEIAVEVEASLKSEREIGSILTSYRQTFLKRMPCAGLLIVAGTPAIFSKYQEKIAELPPDIEQQILLTTPEGLRSLNPRVYGVRGEVPGPALEQRRNTSKGVGTYFSMKSTSYTSAISALGGTSPMRVRVF